MLTNVTHFCILLKRNEYGVFLHLSARDWKRACEEICHSRTIQRYFMRALRRNASGDIDENLVPQEIREWYKDSEDEKQTSSESESDCDS